VVCVWVDKDYTFNEDEIFWEGLLELGVDMLCTDHPLEAIETRRKFEEGHRIDTTFKSKL